MCKLSNQSTLPLREQASSCHEHLGGAANGVCTEATAETIQVLQEIGTEALFPNKLLEEQPVGRGRALQVEAEQLEFAEHPDVPKRPFLRRKSVVMPPQKLDWSKVGLLIFNQKLFMMVLELQLQNHAAPTCPLPEVEIFIETERHIVAVEVFEAPS